MEPTYNDAFLDGQNYERKQMMKRAVVGTVYPTTDVKHHPTDLYVERDAWENLFEGCQPGEKVKIVILRDHD